MQFKALLKSFKTSIWNIYFVILVLKILRKIKCMVNSKLTLYPILHEFEHVFSAFYRLASRLNYKLKNLRLELFRTFLISSFQWATLYWPQMSFSTSFILKKKVTLGLVVRIRNSVNFSKLYVGNSMVICVWKHLGNTLILSYGN